MISAMQFRQISSLKRDSTESLLPVKVTYEEITPTKDDSGESRGLLLTLFLLPVALFGSFCKKRNKASKDGDADCRVSIRFADESENWNPIEYKTVVSYLCCAFSAEHETVFWYSGRVFSADLAKAIESVAPFIYWNVPIIIEGEQGTGKKVLAQSIHQSSTSDGNFVIVRCSNYSAANFESALLGTTPSNGLITRAAGGTLYFDQVQMLDSQMQSVLMQLLDGDFDDKSEEGKRRQTSFRVIAASSQELLTLVTSGKFDRDLYSRLKVGYVRLRPLRDQPEAFYSLFRWFVEKAKPIEASHAPVRVVQARHIIPDCDQDVERTLSDYHWPGNIEELRSCAHRCYIEASSRDSLITGHMIRQFWEAPRAEQDSRNYAHDQATSSIAVEPIDSQSTEIDANEKLIRSKTTMMLDAMKHGEKEIGESLGAFFKRRGFRGEYRIPVVRRIVLAHAKFITNENRLIRALGYVEGKPKDQAALQGCNINLNNFTTYLAELDLTLTTLRDPITLEDLLPEEQEWLRKLKRSAVL